MRRTRHITRHPDDDAAPDNARGLVYREHDGDGTACTPECIPPADRRAWLAAHPDAQVVPP